VKMMN